MRSSPPKLCWREQKATSAYRGGWLSEAPPAPSPHEEMRRRRRSTPTKPQAKETARLAGIRRVGPEAARSVFLGAELALRALRQPLLGDLAAQ
eukprot:204268-Alexandrium_andersonii.AAC.1